MHLIFQVTANIQSNSLYGLSNSYIIPALGLSWSNIIKTRFMLYKTSYCIKPNKIFNDDSSSFNKIGSKIENQTIEYRLRNIQVVYCPWLERKKQCFIITESGIKHIDENNPHVYISVECC